MPSALTPMTPELRALIENTHRIEAVKGNSTSKRAISAILRKEGHPVSESMVYQIQKKMSDYNPQKSYAPKKPSRTPQAQISANAYRVAFEYLTDKRYSTEGLTNSQIIDKANDKKGYRRKQDLIKVRSKLTTYAKSKFSPEKVAAALSLRDKLNADRSLAQNKSFINEVESVKNIGKKEPTTETKGQIRRALVKRQTPLWALNPAQQVELASYGYDVSRGKSDKNVNIKKVFPGKFFGDHIERLTDRGLNVGNNMQLLNYDQEQIKKGYENRRLLEKAKTLFQFNRDNLPRNVRGLLPETTTAFQNFFPEKLNPPPVSEGGGDYKVKRSAPSGGGGVFGPSGGRWMKDKMGRRIFVIM